MMNNYVQKIVGLGLTAMLGLGCNPDSASQQRKRPAKAKITATQTSCPDVKMTSPYVELLDQYNAEKQTRKGLETNVSELETKLNECRSEPTKVTGWYQKIEENIDNPAKLKGVVDQYLQPLGGELVVLKGEDLFDAMCSAYHRDDDYLRLKVEFVKQLPKMYSEDVLKVPSGKHIRFKI